MGSQVRNWCDCCGKEDTELIGYWFGTPSEFYQSADGIIPKNKINKIEVCSACFKQIETTTKSWSTKKYINQN